MLNMYSASDAISDERFMESCKSEIVARATAAKLMGYRSASRGPLTKKPKTVFVGRIDMVESVMPVRERSDFTTMSAFESFMGEPKKEPLTFVTGFAAAKETKPVQREKLPTARVFKIDRRSFPHRWVEHLRFCD